MSVILSNADRDRLVKVLALMESNHDGERAAAAWKASEMLRGRGLTWADIIPTGSSPGWASPPQSPRPPSTPAASWTAQVQFVISREHLLTQWERGFIASVACRSRITPKQGAVLVSVVDRLMAREST